MLADLILNPITRSTLEALSQQPPQALLITGPPSIGKTTAALAWAREVTGTQRHAIHHVAPDEKGSIGIDAIRDLYRTSRNRRTDKQIIIIEQAAAMSLEAQNAFLKLLEEPRPHVLFILCAETTESLLPTILSRTQQITIRPVTTAVLDRLIIKEHPEASPADRAQLLFIAEGRVGLLQQLLHDPAKLQREREAVLLAKQLLTASPYDRYRRLGTLTAERATCLSTLGVMMRIAEVQLAKSSTSNELNYWLRVAASLENALFAAEHNGNLKAHLLQLFSRL